MELYVALQPGFQGRILNEYGSVRGSPNSTIGNFTNGTIGSQWYHWLTNGTTGATGRANGTIGITIGINGIHHICINLLVPRYTKTNIGNPGNQQN